MVTTDRAKYDDLCALLIGQHRVMHTELAGCRAERDLLRREIAALRERLAER